MMKSILFVILVALAMGSFAAPLGLNVRDLLKMTKVAGLAAGPKYTAVSLSKYYGDDYITASSLYLVDLDGKLKQLTYNDASFPYRDVDPRWLNAEGTVLAFISNRSGSRQLWTVRADGSELHQMTKVPYDIDTFKVSPSFDTIAFSASVNVKQQLGLPTTGATTGRVYEKLMVRHWDVWRTDERSHIFTIPLYPVYDEETHELLHARTAADEVVDLMYGVWADSPVPPSDGSEDYEFYADGSKVAFTLRMDDVDMAWKVDLKIYSVKTRGPGGIENMELLTKNHEGLMDFQPTFSSDGKYMAYLSSEVPQAESDRCRVKLLDLKAGTTKVLTEAWDRSVASLAFAADNANIYFTAADNARTKLWSVSIADSKVTVLHEVGGVGNVKPVVRADGEKIFLTRSRFVEPDDVYYLVVSEAKKNPQTIHRLTKLNEDILKPLTLSAPVDFTFTGANGDKVQGYYFAPINYTANAKYPFVMYIHGGPESAFKDSWSYRWNPNTITADGVGVVMINFHGSDSFGQKFTDSIRGDWGGKPKQDIMLGMEYALKTWPYLDRNRAGAMGASFGGFMAYWLQATTTNFKCLISHDGGSNTLGRYGSTDELWFAEYEMLGKPWDEGSKYNDANPMLHAEQWKTPMLIIHGEKDYRLPIDQALTAFTILQRYGVPSRLLYFPDENHWTAKPANTLLWHDTVIDWLNRYLHA